MTRDALSRWADLLPEHIAFAQAHYELDQQTVRAVKALGSMRAAAKRLGVCSLTIRHRLNRAARCKPPPVAAWSQAEAAALRLAEVQNDTVRRAKKALASAKYRLEIAREDFEKKTARVRELAG